MYEARCKCGWNSNTVGRLRRDAEDHVKATFPKSVQILPHWDPVDVWSKKHEISFGDSVVRQEPKQLQLKLRKLFT